MNTLSSFRVVVVSSETNNYPTAQDLLRHLSPTRIHRDLIFEVMVLDQRTQQTFRGAALPEYVHARDPHQLISDLGIEQEIMEIRIVIDTDAMFDRLNESVDSIKATVKK
jgi:hypothetical protein